MIKPKPEMYQFNDGKSQTILDFSRVNEAWLVWRQDPGSQGNVKIHPSYDEAKRDYDNRVDAIQEMEALNAEDFDQDSYDESDEAIWNNEAALEQGRFQ